MSEVSEKTLVSRQLEAKAAEMDLLAACREKASDLGVPLFNSEKVLRLAQEYHQKYWDWRINVDLRAE